MFSFSCLEKSRAVLSARLAVLSHFFPQQRGDVFPVTRAVAPRRTTKLRKKTDARLDFSRRPTIWPAAKARQRYDASEVGRAHARLHSPGLLGTARRASNFCTGFACFCHAMLGMQRRRTSDLLDWTLPAPSPTSTGRFWVTPSRCRVRHKFPTYPGGTEASAVEDFPARGRDCFARLPCFANGSGVFGCCGRLATAPLPFGSRSTLIGKQMHGLFRRGPGANKVLGTALYPHARARAPGALAPRG